MGTMATGGRPTTPQFKHPLTSTTDCPHCGSLCLGSVVLPCGHISCRRCLHKALQEPGSGSGCKRCGQQLDLPKDQALTVSQLMQQFGTDPVMEHMVYQQLENDTDIRCVTYPNDQATYVCVTCHKYCCDACSASHCRTRVATKGHVLRLLPQPLLNAPSAAWTTPKPASPSIQSTSSLERSIPNLDDTQSSGASRGESRGVEEWKEWVGREVGLLERACSKQLQAETRLQNIMFLGQQLLDKVQTNLRVMNEYQHHLPRFNVIQRTDHNSYDIHVPSADVMMQVLTPSLERRLCDIRSCQCPDMNRVKVVEKELNKLLHFEDQDSSADTSSTTSRTSPSPSSIPSPTSSPPSSISPTSSLLSPPTPSAAPSLVFKVSAETADDTETPRIIAVVCLPDDTLVMADNNNRKVKVMGMAPPNTVSASLAIPERPWALAVLSDGLVAMTTTSRTIYLMEVTASTVTVRSRVQTVRRYEGIAGHSDRHLLGSCVKSVFGPASVDVLNREGQVVRTVTDSTRLTRLGSPYYLFDTGDHHVLVSDWRTEKVHQVCVRSGQVTQTFEHDHVKWPRQVCADEVGSVYIASCNGVCVCVRSREGEWRQLVTPSLHGPSQCLYPHGLCLTISGHLVVTWWGSGVDCVVVGYRLR
ncbi:uncharacterized protein LOC143276553 [Babylonia areolata]|uniref:uncharacterized protein LOC143276553 n=1 Tax=Babylonia areolata TaxID=304850 RepID=UPI003FD62047